MSLEIPSAPLPPVLFYCQHLPSVPAKGERCTIECFKLFLSLTPVVTVKWLGGFFKFEWWYFPWYSAFPVGQGVDLSSWVENETRNEGPVSLKPPLLWGGGSEFSSSVICGLVCSLWQGGTSGASEGGSDAFQSAPSGTGVRSSVWGCPVLRVWQDGEGKLCSRTHLSSAPCTAHLFSCTHYNCSAIMEMMVLTPWGNTVHFRAEELRELERFCQRSHQKTCDRAGDELESIVSFPGKALSFTLSFQKVLCCLFTSAHN